MIIYYTINNRKTFINRKTFNNHNQLQFFNKIRNNPSHPLLLYLIS